MKNYDFFSEKEITCNCGCGANNVDDIFMQMLVMARKIAKIPFNMLSICRCKRHNIREGGSLTSSHISTLEIKCKAGDIKCNNSRKRFIIIDSLKKAGFNRIGIAKNFIHADNDESKAERVIWVY